MKATKKRLAKPKPVPRAHPDYKVTIGMKDLRDALVRANMNARDDLSMTFSQRLAKELGF